MRHLENKFSLTTTTNTLGRLFFLHLSPPLVGAPTPSLVLRRALSLDFLTHRSSFLPLILYPLLTCEYFSHTKQFCSISEMSYNSTQFWYCLPGNNIRFHRLRTRSYKAAPTTQLRIPITSPGCPCTTYPQAIDRRFQWASPYVWLIC